MTVAAGSDGPLGARRGARAAARRGREAGSRSCRSRAAAPCAGKIARASARSSRPAVARRDVRQREHPDLAPRARSARPAAAVEWPVSRARSRSSSPNVASWISRSAPCAAIASVSHGAVSPETTTLRPSRGGADHLLGAHAGDGLAALQAAEVGPGRDAERAPRARRRSVRGARPRRARSRRRARGGGR